MPIEQRGFGVCSFPLHLGVWLEQMAEAGKKLDEQGPSEAERPRRLADGTLRTLGQHFFWQRRTRKVNDDLAVRLAELDGERWHFERDLPVVGYHLPIPFVLFGPTGVFLLEGSAGFWTNEDIASMSSSARTIEWALPGYPCPVRPAIVLIGHEQEPREHFTAAGEGPCWELGEGWLGAWLHRFSHRGLTPSDVAALRGMADCAGLRERRRLFVPEGEG